ncbi:MAG: hypothetical protein AB7O39_03370 [Flavobacteriaceae bacterium]
MAHPDDFDYLVEIGCEVMDRTLGIHEMPAGYHLMLNLDRTHFFWMERATGRCSDEHWDKWASYRGAKADALTDGGSNGDA